jgi:hypothetical protein
MRIKAKCSSSCSGKYLIPYSILYHAGTWGKKEAKVEESGKGERRVKFLDGKVERSEIFSVLLHVPSRKFATRF